MARTNNKKESAEIAAGRVSVTARQRAVKNTKERADGNGSNRDRSSCDCHPDQPVAYVRTVEGDSYGDEALSVAVQALACAQHARRKHHRRIGAVFCDTASATGRSGHGERAGGSGSLPGLDALLAHLAVCHSKQVIVHRLDRMPDDYHDRDPRLAVTALGTAIEPYDSDLPRNATRQHELFALVDSLNDRDGVTGGPHGGTKKGEWLPTLRLNRSRRNHDA